MMTSSTNARASLTGSVLVDGEATGEVLTLRAPLNLWNGLDPETGRIREPGHPDLGADITGSILVLTGVKGATASIGLTECLRSGHGPAGLVLAHRDVTVVMAVVVAGLLYDKEIPVLHLPPEHLNALPHGPATLAGDTLTFQAPAGGVNG